MLFHAVHNHSNRISCLILSCCLTLTGCGSEAVSAFEIPTERGTRDYEAVCLTPEAPGRMTFSEDTYLVDYSNASEGYITASYFGSNDKVKMKLEQPDGTTYTYNLTSAPDVFPLSSDSGTYIVTIFENISEKAYSTLMSEEFDVNIENEFGAYLYPNQYVNFHAGDDTIALGEQLSYSADTDLDVISNTYNYVITHISYDTAKAESVQSGYLPDIDATLESGTGICLDYAAVMASILRSQSIPTHMEVGYAGTVYHAWISSYIKDVGWVNGIIQFDGKDWEMMDPTFGASTGEKKLKKYIGDGDYYRVKYIY